MVVKYMAIAEADGIDRRPGEGGCCIVQFCLAVSDFGNIHSIVAIADDGTLWRLSPSERQWQPFPALPDGE